MCPPPPLHIYTHAPWNLSHRKWSCTASCLGRQIIHLFFLKKCTFPPLLHIFPPQLHALPVFFPSFIVFPSVLRRRTVTQTESWTTCVISDWAAFRPWTSCRCGCAGPQNSGKYSPLGFPQDLWYSCPQYPHNAFVEFPKGMKSRFIWTVLKSKTQVFLITARLLHITV